MSLPNSVTFSKLAFQFLVFCSKIRNKNSPSLCTPLPYEFGDKVWGEMNLLMGSIGNRVLATRGQSPFLQKGPARYEDLCHYWAPGHHRISLPQKAVYFLPAWRVLDAIVSPRDKWEGSVHAQSWCGSLWGGPLGKRGRKVGDEIRELTRGRWHRASQAIWRILAFTWCSAGSEIGRRMTTTTAVF